MTLVIVTVIALGTFSLSYLTKELESSRTATLRRRLDRITRFANNIPPSRGINSLPAIFREFTIVSPETDYFQAEDEQHHRLFPTEDGVPDVAWPKEACLTPCMTVTTLRGRHMRLMQQTVLIHGQIVRLSLAGQIDEHSGIIAVVRNSFLISLPILLALSLGGGLLLAHSAMAPVDRMTRAAQKISIRDLKRRLPVPDTGDEIQRLAVAWNEVLDRLDSAVSRLTQFTSDISHDLKTSLTVMSATAQVTLRRDRNAHEYREAMKTVLLECASTTELLEDLLAASHTETDDRLRWELLSLSEIVEEVCDQSKSRCEVKQLALSRNIQHDLHLLGEPSLIRRMVMILLDNGIKYTPMDGSIHIDLHEEDESIRLSVNDTGIGISAEHIDRIFERSYRADHSRTRSGGGNGLGLTIAKSIVDLHYGQIEIRSRVDAGSCFTVTFPVSQETHDHDAKRTSDRIPVIHLA
jgi:signal transduction histidine kinase